MVQQVADQTPRRQYTATASQTVFAYPFQIFVKGDLSVYVNGALKTVDVDYTVSGVGTLLGGNITLTTSSTAGDIVTVHRTMSFDRETDYQDNGDFLANDVNEDMNRLWLAEQQNREALNRSLQYAVDDVVGSASLPSKAARINKLLSFDENGNPSVTTPSSGAGSNALNVAFDPAGDAAVVSTVQAKLREMVSAKDFGATGGDDNDDSVAINSAISALSDGGELRLPIPSAAYKTTSSINITEGVALVGTGVPTRDYALSEANCTVIKPTGDVRQGIKIRGARGSAIKNIIVDMSGVTASASGTITAITNADPAVVTIAGHDFNDGDVIKIASVGGMTELNDKHFVAQNGTANTFELEGIDSTGFGTFTSGGTATLRPCGIVLNGAWYFTLENIFITGMQNDTHIGVCLIASQQGTQWGNCVRIFARDHNSAVGSAVVCQGTIGNSSGRVNQVAWTSCNFNSAGDGWLMDECGAGHTFTSCTAEVMARDGVKITDNSTAGYPVFQGGEFSSNGGYGINGLSLVINTSCVSNSSGRVNLGTELRQTSNGTLNLYTGGLGFNIASGGHVEEVTGKFRAVSQSITGSAVFEVATRSQLGSNSVWLATAHRNGNAQHAVAIVEALSSAGTATVNHIAGGAGTIAWQIDGSNNLELTNTGTTADHNYSVVKLSDDGS